MSSAEFPPSSPYLNHLEEEDSHDPFSSLNHRLKEPRKKLIINSPFKGKEDLLPTPNPSSSTGYRSSSPVRVPLTPNTKKEANHPETKQDLVLKGSLKIRLLPNVRTTLGRSSRCDYFIKSKFASREHLTLFYAADNDEIIIECQGFNGCVVEFGKRTFGYVRQVNDNSFVFQQFTKAKNEDEVFEKLSIFRNERLVIPYIEGLKLDLKGYVMQIAVVTSDDSETEDELPTLNHSRLSSIEPQSALPTRSDSKDFPSKITGTSKNVSLVPSTLENTITSNAGVPPSIAKDDFEINEIKATDKTSAPLQLKTDNSLNNESYLSRRRKAEPGNSPQKKKVNRELLGSLKETTVTNKKHLQPREKIEQLNIEEILATIKNLDDIENVLTNHLAFSRLSQSPLRQLQTVSALTQSLSRSQMRAVLAHIPCVGVIYRPGKDAAGKPLDEEYYYAVEKDEDLARTKLVSSIKGSSGLRNCRKTHKQYFWKKPVTHKK